MFKLTLSLSLFLSEVSRGSIQGLLLCPMILNSNIMTTWYGSHTCCGDNNNLLCAYNIADWRDHTSHQKLGWLQDKRLSARTTTCMQPARKHYFLNYTCTIVKEYKSYT